MMERFIKHDSETPTGILIETAVADSEAEAIEGIESEKEYVVPYDEAEVIYTEDGYAPEAGGTLYVVRFEQ